MSDYYYFNNMKDDDGFCAILGDDYIAALLSIAEKHGLKISDEMILNEVYGRTELSHKSKSKKNKI